VSRASEIEFMRVKVDLMEKYFKTDEAREFKKKMYASLDLIPTYKEWAKVSSVYADRELDRLIEFEEVTNPAFTETDSKQLFHELRLRFGYSRLGGSPMQVAKRVLKRKHIKDEEEYYMVKDLLSNVYPKASASLSPERTRLLRQMFDGYSKK
jgi:hypothetical protein